MTIEVLHINKFLIDGVIHVATHQLHTNELGGQFTSTHWSTESSAPTQLNLFA